jgi:hypothetical protein
MKSPLVRVHRIPLPRRDMPPDPIDLDQLFDGKPVLGMHHAPH